jgi:hypothetical protein
MTYSALPVARLPNIQISFDNDTTQSLFPLTVAFNNFIANEANNSNWVGEKNVNFTVSSNSITVLKKTLLISNLRSYTYPANTGDHLTVHGIFDISGTLLSNEAYTRQWTTIATSGALRSQYYTTAYACQTAYAIVDANTTIQVKTTGSTSNGVDASSHIILMQLEA